MVPSIIHQLVNSPKSKKADLSSLTFLGSGSAYLPESLAQKALGLAPQGAAFNEGNSSPTPTLFVIVDYDMAFQATGCLKGR